jgi:hypothetical protein
MCIQQSARHAVRNRREVAPAARTCWFARHRRNDPQECDAPLHSRLLTSVVTRFSSANGISFGESTSSDSRARPYRGGLSGCVVSKPAMTECAPRKVVNRDCLLDTVIGFTTVTIPLDRKCARIRTKLVAGRKSCARSRAAASSRQKLPIAKVLIRLAISNRGTGDARFTVRTRCRR